MVDMREIGFRGRDKCGRWAYGDLAHKDGFIFIDGICIDPETIGQDTGLQSIDSNRYIAWGPEDVKDFRIFEGDIVKTTVKITDGKVETIVHVFFSELCASFMLAGGILCGPKVMHKNGKYEVIGNIHDTPELLRKTP
jgi:hypothetical protein